VNSSGQIYKISISSEKGTKKANIEFVELKEDFGIIGDAHAGSNRQVSLLPFESFDKVKNDILDIKPGDFAENITTYGIDYSDAEVGKKMKLGSSVILEITNIGKECHQSCNIRQIVGDCIMPREGIFTKVLRGGKLSPGDKIRWSK
jgi:MOSC domain-containing protein YiiM